MAFDSLFIITKPISLEEFNDLANLAPPSLADTNKSSFLSKFTPICSRKNISSLEPSTNLCTAS